MSQPFADALSWVPKSRHLAATLSRAHDFARGLSHRSVTLEHVLLALIEDPDASAVLQACQIDLERLRAEVDAHLVAQPRIQLAVPEADRDLVRILDYAVAAAQQSRRREVNGAIVLAAIVGEGKSQAAAILQANGLTFAEAIRALQSATAAPRSPLPAASVAATQATEEILASTRRKLDASRLGQGGPQPPAPPPADGLPPLPPAGFPPQSNGAMPGPQRAARTPPPIPPLPPPPPTGAREVMGGLVEAIRGAGALRPAPTSPQEPTLEARKPPPAGGPPPIVPGALPADGATTPAPPLGPAGFDPARLAQGIPRSMRVGATATIEVRLPRAEVVALASSLDGGSAVYEHSNVVTKAMALRLRAPDGGFFVESASSEIQWIESTLGFLNDDYASWRWSVTPRRSGRQRLLLAVSVRSVGSDGAAAETALPDQMVEVDVGGNRLRALARWSGWIVAAIVGAVIGRLGDAPVQTVIVALRGLVE